MNTHIRDNLQYLHDYVVSDWIALSGYGSFTYSSADSPTFVASTPVDLTGVIPVGARVELTQTTTKFFIVTAISATTITLYGGTGYTLTTAAITLPYFSTVWAPIGFPLSPALWSVSLVNTSLYSQGSPVTTTWYNLGSLSLSFPIGVWKVSAYGQIGYASGTGDVQAATSLSTSNNSESNMQFTTAALSSGASLSISLGFSGADLTLTTKTTYYWIERVVGTATTLYVLNDRARFAVVGLCAYL